MCGSMSAFTRGCVKTRFPLTNRENRPAASLPQPISDDVSDDKLPMKLATAFSQPWCSG